MGDEQIKKALEDFIRIWEKAEREKEEILDRVDYSKVSKRELVRILYEVMIQDCWDGGRDNKGDSGAISAYADALRLLARLGLFEIEREYGRVVIGRFKGW